MTQFKIQLTFSGQGCPKIILAFCVRAGNLDCAFNDSLQPQLSENYKFMGMFSDISLSGRLNMSKNWSKMAKNARF